MGDPGLVYINLRVGSRAIVLSLGEETAVGMCVAESGEQIEVRRERRKKGR